MVIEELLSRARQGDAEALGTLLQSYRNHLRVLAEQRLGARVRARVDASDIVQQTLLEAQRDLPAFRGELEEELLAWLNRILQNNVYQTVQQHLAVQKRSARVEQSLHKPLAGGQTLGDLLADDVSSPSQKALRGEAHLQLAEAIERLPEDQRQAVRLRHLEGYTLKEIAAAMQRSEVAAAGLIKRGLQRLKHLLREASESGTVD